VWHLLVEATTLSAHDAVVRAVAQAAARTAYVAVCLSLCWGVLVTTGWVGRLAGRQPMRRSHATLGVFAVVFSLVHVVALMLVTGAAVRMTLPIVSVPFFAGSPPRWAFGIIALELMIAILVTSAARRLLDYVHWLRMHRAAYAVVALAAAHSWWGAAVNGHLALLWLAGATVATVTALVAVLRFVPARQLARIGLISP
jgi:sulfoxide reductase heme-binding subunit YedZ